MLCQNQKLQLVSLLAVLFLLFIIQSTNAQFTTVINVPPDVAPTSIDSDTQLNLSAGGSIGNFFDAGATDGSSTNVEVNIAGGTVGNFFAAFDGSKINISGGSFGNSFGVGFGSDATISGGEFRLNGTLIEGLDTPGATQPFTLLWDSVLSGTLADGTPFAFTSFDSYGDALYETITLSVTSLPTIGPPAIVVPDEPAPSSIRSGQTLTLNRRGHLPNNFNAGYGSQVIINDGRVGENYRAVGAQTSIHEGYAEDIKAYSGSYVNITGGSIDFLQVADESSADITGGSINDIDLINNSTANISEGTIGDIYVTNSSTATISGDTTPTSVTLKNNGTLNLSGNATVNNVSLEYLFEPCGTVNLSGNSTVTILGAGYAVLNISGGLLQNAQEGISNLQVNVTGGAIGDYFVPSGSAINISAGTVGNNFNPRASTVNISGGTIGSDFRAGNSTTHISGGIIGDGFIANNGSLNMTGGSIGDNARMAATTSNLSGGTIGNQALVSGVVNVSGASIGNNLTLEFVGEVNLSSGSIGDDFFLEGHGPLNMTGGTIGDRLRTQGASPVSISSGVIGNDFHSQGGAVVITGGSIGNNYYAQNDVYISGGSIGDNFSALGTVNLSGGTVKSDFFDEPAGFNLKLFGTQFIVDGVDITDTLTTNSLTQIPIPNSTLSGMLADGSPYSFLLDSFGVPSASHGPHPSTLKLMLIEPGDFDGSQDVDGSDFLQWQRGLYAYQDDVDFSNWESNFGHLSDFDGDGDTDGNDFLTWQRGFGDLYDTNNLADWEAKFGTTAPAFAATAIPEPTTAVMLLLALTCGFSKGHRVRRKKQSL